MGRRRKYATVAEKQAAWRDNQARHRLRQIPQVHAAGYSLYQGDALALVPLLGPFDHCITDPPYEAETHSAMRRTLAHAEARMVYAPLDFIQAAAPVAQAGWRAPVYGR